MGNLARTPSVGLQKMQWRPNVPRQDTTTSKSSIVGNGPGGAQLDRRDSTEGIAQAVGNDIRPRRPVLIVGLRIR